MLYTDTLNKFTPYIELAFDSLFDTAFANQSDPNDLLILIENGFHQELGSFSGVKMSPYVVGPGDEGWDEQTQFEFHDIYRRSLTERTKVFAGWKNDKIERAIKTSVQLELIIYLKFWESNRIVKVLYTLARLTKGESYDWHFRADKFKVGKAKKGRSYILNEEVKAVTQNTCPLFAMLMEDCYSEQIRNAVAHSQFSLSQSHIRFSNYEPGQPYHQLRGLPLEKWEEYFCSVIVMYNALLRNISKYTNHCVSLARGKHYGLPLRVTKADGSISKEWYTYLSDAECWTWYKNTAQARGEKHWL